MEKVRPARQNPPREPQPEPTVTQTSTIPQEPVVTVPGSTTAQQQPIITVQTQYDHLKLGVPGKADTIIDRPGYALGYIEYHEQPAWVIYRLTKEQALTKAAKRGDDFKEDPEVPQEARRWRITAAPGMIADILPRPQTWPTLCEQWATASS